MFLRRLTAPADDPAHRTSRLAPITDFVPQFTQDAQWRPVVCRGTLTLFILTQVHVSDWLCCITLSVPHGEGCVARIGRPEPLYWPKVGVFSKRRSKIEASVPSAPYRMLMETGCSHGHKLGMNTEDREGARSPAMARLTKPLWLSRPLGDG